MGRSNKKAVSYRNNCIGTPFLRVYFSDSILWPFGKELNTSSKKFHASQWQDKMFHNFILFTHLRGTGKQNITECFLQLDHGHRFILLADQDAHFANTAPTKSLYRLLMCFYRQVVDFTNMSKNYKFQVPVGNNT